MKLKTFFATCALSALASVALAQPGQLTVKVDKPGVKISPMFYGLMTEEINHAYDGGLYAELIQNRVFKDNAKNPVHWSLIQGEGGAGTMSLDTAQSLNEALPVSLKLNVTTPGTRVGVANDGYWGIPVKPNTGYNASFYAKGNAGPLMISIESNDGKTIVAKDYIKKVSDTWQKYEVTLKTGNAAPGTNYRFVISTTAPGTLWLNLVSLMPPTYKNRPNGLRPDLMQLMGDMKPAYLRFPGGNYLEGNTIAERFDWKKTIGPLENRPGHQAPWGYRSSDGMGLMEFLYWCEDLNMEPLLGVFAGYALRGEVIKAGPELTPFVQDALDEIEFITGDATTKWGAERAKLGHPKPFNLTYVEIGNEDWFDKSGSYDGRFTQFHDAIKAKYPKLQLISTNGVNGGVRVTSRKPDVLDDHYYRSAAAMARDAHHYDKTDRNGPKIFVGEWASTEGSPTPTMQAALGDAAWLTGLERNSDIVVMECYAPLLVNVNPGARQWGTNLIGYDALNSFASPSYYVQKMFGNNRGDVVLPVEIAPQKVDMKSTFTPKGSVGIGTWLTQAEFKDAKVTSGDKVLFQSDFANGTQGWKKAGGDWKTSDGVLMQTNPGDNIRLTTGDVNWTDYTYEIKARKTGGAEGFLILFHVENSNDYIWWNLGGWGNSRSVIERARGGNKTEIGPQLPVTIETGRWYDIKIEVKGRDIKAYLDGKLLAEATDDPGAPADPLYATSSRDEKTGDVIIKVVNVSAAPQQLSVNLQGVTKVTGALLETISGDPADVNSLAEPLKVAPKTMKLAVTAPNFVQEFPAHSASVLRVKTK